MSRISDQIENGFFVENANCRDTSGLCWFYRYNTQTNEAILVPGEVSDSEVCGRKEITVKPAVSPVPTSEIRIPEVLDGHPIVGVDRFAFYKAAFRSEYSYSCRQQIERIHIPSCVRYVGKSAFAYCNTVMEITGCLSAETIGPFAFFGCKSLKAIEICSGTKYIKEYAFLDCSEATHLWLPEGLVEIGPCAFEGCDRLENVDLPDSVRWVNESCFERTSCRITYPETLGFGFSPSVRWRLRTNNALKRGLFNFLIEKICWSQVVFRMRLDGIDHHEL